MELYREGLQILRLFAKHRLIHVTLPAKVTAIDLMISEEELVTVPTDGHPTFLHL
jgi:hypothetical protein